MMIGLNPVVPIIGMEEGELILRNLDFDCMFSFVLKFIIDHSKNNICLNPISIISVDYSLSLNGLPFSTFVHFSSSMVISPFTNTYFTPLANSSPFSQLLLALMA